MLKPGEILYYGRNIWHHTRNLDSKPVTMTITGTLITAYNFDTVSHQLYNECAYESLHFDFSAKLCDQLDKCYDLWYQKYLKKNSPYKSWRENASKNLKKKRKYSTTT